MDDLPEPLTPQDCDLTGTDWMPMHCHRLFKSDFYLKSSDQVKVVALELWWSAWLQVPAASLPDDDAAIAKLAGFGRDLKGWAKIKDDVLHGFVKCRDGRLYHAFLANEAIISYDRLLKSQEKRESDRARLKSWRESERLKKLNNNSYGSDVSSVDETSPETDNETSSETRFVGGLPYLTLPKKERKKEEPPLSPLPPEPPKAAELRPSKTKPRSQLPERWAPNAEGLALARQKRLDVAETLARFSDYHRAKGSLMADWNAAWGTWCRSPYNKPGASKISSAEANNRRIAELHAELMGDQPPPPADMFAGQTVEGDFAYV